MPSSGLITDDALTVALPPPADIGDVEPSAPITAIDDVVEHDWQDVTGVLQ